ncbi:MAG: hypothetical protein HZB33_08030 [Nitrospirae bacterium]|nr:hypothetical protein [Nitrospirota bacterium]
MEKDKTCQKIYFGAKYPDIERAINEATDIISRTKDIETGIIQFAAVRRNIAKLSAMSPYRLRINIALNGKEVGKGIEIGGSESDDSVKRLEKDWIRETSIEKIETLMKHAEAMSDHVMYAELLRDSLRAALKGLEYLPGDKLLQAQAALVEGRLKFLTENG